MAHEVNLAHEVNMVDVGIVILDVILRNAFVPFECGLAHAVAVQAGSSLSWTILVCKLSMFVLSKHADSSRPA